jgi:hypothetical protein
LQQHRAVVVADGTDVHIVEPKLRDSLTATLRRLAGEVDSITARDPYQQKRRLASVDDIDTMPSRGHRTIISKRTNDPFATLARRFGTSGSQAGEGVTAPFETPSSVRIFLRR